MSSSPFGPKSRVNAPALQSDEDPISYEALLVVDLEAHIRFSYWGVHEKDREWIACPDGTRLSAPIASRFGELVGDRTAMKASCIIGRDGAKTLRLSRLDGQEALFAIVLEADRNDGKLSRAISRYQLTRRQSEVLSLLLDGASASDVARALIISEYTAQGYVKCLLTKTGSRNRAEMVSKVLLWKSNDDSGKTTFSVARERAM